MLCKEVYVFVSLQMEEKGGEEGQTLYLTPSHLVGNDKVVEYDEGFCPFALVLV